MTAPSNKTQSAADALVQAHRTARQLDVEPFRLSGEDEAYQVQALVADELGLQAGWKLGLNAEGRVVYAPLYAERTHRSPATLSRQGFNRFLLESELAISFRQPLPPRAEPYSLAEVQAAAGFIHSAFEIVDTRFAAWPDVEPLWLLADGLSHGSFILGQGVELKDPQMLTHAAYELVVNGELAQKVERAHPQPDPWDSILQLANRLRAQELGIGEGDVITTGSFSGVTPLEPHQWAEVRFAGIGGCRLNLVECEGLPDKRKVSPS